MNTKGGYIYIGKVRGYDYNDVNRTTSFQLYVKVVDGTKYYYCISHNDNSVKKLVDKHNGTIESNNRTYVIDYDFD